MWGSYQNLIWTSRIRTFRGFLKRLLPRRVYEPKGKLPFIGYLQWTLDIWSCCEVRKGPFRCHFPDSLFIPLLIPDNLFDAALAQTAESGQRNSCWNSLSDSLYEASSCGFFCLCNCSEDAFKMLLLNWVLGAETEHLTFYLNFAFITQTNFKTPLAWRAKYNNI